MSVRSILDPSKNNPPKKSDLQKLDIIGLTNARSDRNFMSDPNRYRNPFRINEPLLIFAWPAPQVLPCLLLMGASGFIGHFLLFFCISVAWYLLYQHVTVRYPRGILLHYVWWHGYTTSLTKETTTVPDPMKREYFQ